jgi:hypothetical protein
MPCARPSALKCWLRVPGAGLDRIDRTAIRFGLWLANAYGRETGIAEYVLGEMIALPGSFVHRDANLLRGVWDSQWVVGTAAPPLWPELAGKTLTHIGVRPYRSGRGPSRSAFDMWICAEVRTRPSYRAGWTSSANVQSMPVE